MAPWLWLRQLLLLVVAGFLILEVCYAPGSRWGHWQYPRQAAQEYTVAMETEKVVKYRKKFKLVPIPGTGSRKLEIWLQYTVGHLLINLREAEKMAGSQAQEVYEYFMVVRHPVDRLVSLCREYQPLVLEPNQCIQGLLNGSLRSGPFSRLRSMKDYMDEFSVEHILRYEFLGDDLPNLLRSHNLSINEELPVSETQRPNLWPSTLQMIYSNFSEDLKHFNYSIPNSTLESLETRPPTMSVAPSVIPSVTPIRYPHVAPSVIPSVTPIRYPHVAPPLFHLRAESFQQKLAQTSSGGVPLSNDSWVEQPKRRRRVLKFIHITKTAGTAIEDWARQQGLLWGRFHMEYHAQGEPGSPWHHPFQKLQPSLRKRYDWFMVVRNPVERVVSEYYCPWTGTRTPGEDTEDAFNAFVQRSLNGSRHLEPGSFRSQSEYLDPTSVQHILRYETLISGLARLLPQYGIPFRELPRKNVATGRKFDSSHLHPKTLRMIADTYAADFKNFNYSHPKF